MPRNVPDGCPAPFPAGEVKKVPWYREAGDFQRSLLVERRRLNPRLLFVLPPVLPSLRVRLAYLVIRVGDQSLFQHLLLHRFVILSAAKNLVVLIQLRSFTSFRRTGKIGFATGSRTAASRINFSRQIMLQWHVMERREFVKQVGLGLAAGWAVGRLSWPLQCLGRGPGAAPGAFGRRPS